jgi:hypothetical protein
VSGDDDIHREIPTCSPELASKTEHGMLFSFSIENVKLGKRLEDQPQQWQEAREDNCEERQVVLKRLHDDDLEVSYEVKYDHLNNVRSRLCRWVSSGPYSFATPGPISESTSCLLRIPKYGNVVSRNVPYTKTALEHPEHYCKRFSCNRPNLL